MNSRLKVLLSTEGTYPFHQGGVSTWCNILINNLRGIDYVLYSIIMNPYVSQKFNIPANVSLIKVPLWGTEEPSEHLSIPFSQVYISKRNTDEKAVKDHFAPLFIDLINEILSVDNHPKRFGSILYELHRYFQVYEYKQSFKSEIIWNIYKNFILSNISTTKSLLLPNIYSLTQSLGWIYRFFNILNTPVPEVHVTHSAAAAFCGIPCVLAKLRNNTPFLLTEHGVYLREQYFSLSQRGYSSFLNTFLIRMIHSITGLSYAFADQVSPVCHYNTRWEKQFGVDEGRIEVIYNGVDSSLFQPVYRRNRHPTVVTVARIDPIKDIKTLLMAAAIVKKRIPKVRFVVYGSVEVPEYFAECQKLQAELDLRETFIFAGHTSDVPAAYHSGDIVALSSISEGFPYSVVEAMMCEKPVIATDVGGIKEALGDTGIVVKPRSPDEFAEAIILLIENPALRASMGVEARERALNNFTLTRVLDLYFKNYMKLANKDDKASDVSFRLKKQRLLVEKGYALMASGFYEEAINQFRSALKLGPKSPAVPVILTEIANAYNCLGQYYNALYELEKIETIEEFIRDKQSA